MEAIENEKKSKRKERFMHGILEDDSLTTSEKYKKHDASIKYLDRAIEKTGMVD